MNIFVEESEISEIRIIDVVRRSDDNGKVIESKHGKGNHERKSELEKEIIANDALEIGVRAAARLHDVSPESASSYANGEDISDPDAKTRILATRHNIADVATAKLMETLGLFDPNAIEKQKDLITAASQLANVVEKLGQNGKNQGNQVVVNFFPPNQKKLADYGQVIDV